MVGFIVNILKVGKTIVKAVERSYPLGLNGVSKIPEKLAFDLHSPQILEALPDHLMTDEGIKLLSLLDGKPLNKVEKFLDACGENLSTFSKAMEKYIKIFGKKTSKGFSESEMQALYKKAFPNIKIPTSVNDDAFLHLNRLSKDTGSQFDAHGMTKIGVTDQLKQLNNILTNGIDKTRPFCTAPLVAKNKGLGAGIGTVAGEAYRDGSFILMSGKGKELTKDGIEFVIVNDAYYDIIDDLAAKFPHINFLRADTAAENIEKLAKI